MKPKFTRDWKKLEDRFYSKEGDPRLNWDVSDLETAFRQKGLTTKFEVTNTSMQWLVSQSVLSRWFQAGEDSYGDRLRQFLSQRQVDEIQKILRTQLLNQTVTWKTSQVLFRIQKIDSKHR